MKVNAWKNIDVQFEADVSLDDCINEMWNIADSEDGPNRKLISVDGATRILSRLDPFSLFDKRMMHPETLALLRERLGKWIEFLEQHGKEINRG